LQLDLVWSAYINGTGTGNTAVTQSNTTFPAAIILFDVPAGSYNVSAIAVGFTPTPTMVTVTVASPVTYVAFAFTPNPGLLTLSVTPASASVLVDGNAVVLTNGNGSEYVPAGVTSIEATNSGYRPYFANVTVNSSAGLIVAITLLAIQPATLSLTVSPASAGVRIDGTAVTLTSGAYDGQWAPGVHSIEVTASGYYAYYNNVSVTSGATTTLMISLHAVSTSSNSTSNPTGTSGIDNAGWAVIVVLAALALVCLIGLIYFARRRPPQSTTGGSTSPPQPWQETHADQEAPPPK
jgi:hypothetical protein